MDDRPVVMITGGAGGMGAAAASRFVAGGWRVAAIVDRDFDRRAGGVVGARDVSDARRLRCDTSGGLPRPPCGPRCGGQIASTT